MLLIMAYQKSRKTWTVGLTSILAVLLGLLFATTTQQSHCVKNGDFWTYFDPHYFQHTQQQTLVVVFFHVRVDYQYDNNGSDNHS